MTTELRQWTIYEHPSDYPDWFVVREWKITASGAESSPIAVLAATLEQARDVLPEGLFCLGRAPTDDPCIVEVWT